jgi:4-amino-4-deoxy-L-arabinose transferase-like glycosyltransferase
MIKMKSFLPLLLFTTFSLMVMALFNGFGLTEGDTGAYIEMGIFSIIPKDRSPFYGWFMRYTSMWTSLWFTIFVQCMMLAYLLLRYIEFIIETVTKDMGQLLGSAHRFTLLVVIVIVSFTCVGWVAGYLMPDVFSAMMLLATLLYLADRSGKAGRLIVYAVFVFIAIIIHNSHFLILLLFGSVLLIWALIKKQKTILKRSVVLVCMSVMGWLLMCTVNAVNGYDFTFSRGSHVFMVTKFAETGILNKYLMENCGRKNLKLCNYQDQIPSYSWDFLWSDDSPLYKTGGWDSNKTEYNIIIHDVFTTPRYLKMFARKSAISTLRELTQVQAPDHATFQGGWSSPCQRVGTFFSDELNEYKNSRQNTSGISATSCNYLYYLFFVLTTVWLLFCPGILSSELKFIYCCVLLFLLCNAFVTSTFSTVVYRFQYRVFWVLPATNAILFIRYYWSRFQVETEENFKEKK